MDTYKLGNKVKVIIRSFAAGKMGNTEMAYDNQPYTIIDGTSLNLSFDSLDKNARHLDFNVLNYNHDTLTQVDINDVALTEKILQLIYQENETPLCTTSENYISDGNIIHLNNPGAMYQMFVYDNEGTLEKAFGEYTEDTLEVEKEDSSYLIVYSFIGETSFLLDKPNNFYCTLDAEIEGNINDTTSTMYLHCEKCGLKVDKSMTFQQRGNAVNLSFEVLKGENYLTVR